MGHSELQVQIALGMLTRYYIYISVGNICVYEITNAWSFTDHKEVLSEYIGGSYRIVRALVSYDEWCNWIDYIYNLPKICEKYGHYTYICGRIEVKIFEDPKG